MRIIYRPQAEITAKCFGIPGAASRNSVNYLFFVRPG
jgi:hypothetical protein